MWSGAKALIAGSIVLGLGGGRDASADFAVSLSAGKGPAGTEPVTQDNTKPSGAQTGNAAPAPSKSVPADETAGAPVLLPNVVLPVTMNFQTWNNVMLVDVLIDGKLQKCALNTGLSGCTITPAHAAALKLAALPSPTTITALNETRAVPQVTLEKVQFNAARIGSLRVGVLDVSELYSGLPQPDAPPLWLGMSFLSAFQVTFDYPGSIITLNRPTAPLPKDKGEVLPIQIRNGQIYTRVTIPNAGSFDALIDTGTLGTVIPASIGAKIKGASVKTLLIKRPGGKQTKAMQITVPRIRVGKLEQEQVPVLFMEALKSDKAGADSGLAVLGVDFLRHYAVTINCARRKMLLVPPAPPENTEGEGNTAKKPPTPGGTRPVPPVNGGVKKGRQ